MPSSLKYAGIAQLVERNLAKVEVASSSLVSRSRNLKDNSSFNEMRSFSYSFNLVLAR